MKDTIHADEGTQIREVCTDLHWYKNLFRGSEHYNPPTSHEYIPSNQQKENEIMWTRQHKHFWKYILKFYSINEMLMAYKNPIPEVHSNIQVWVNQFEQGVYTWPY